MDLSKLFSHEEIVERTGRRIVELEGSLETRLEELRRRAQSEQDLLRAEVEGELNELRSLRDTTEEVIQG